MLAWPASKNTTQSLRFSLLGATAHPAELKNHIQFLFYFKFIPASHRVHGNEYTFRFYVWFTVNGGMTHMSTCHARPRRETIIVGLDIFDPTCN